MSTLPRRWGSVLTLRCLSLTLTAVSVRGTGLQSCGTVSCGLGAECFQNTVCVCLRDNDKRMQQSSTFYCLSKGVTQCGAQLCGDGAECNTDKSVCRCSSSNGALTKQKDTYPPLWYCVGSAKPTPRSTGTSKAVGSSKSPTAQSVTTRNGLTGEQGEHRGSYGGGHSELTTPSNGVTGNQGDQSQQQGDDADDDSQILTIGLAAGIGGAVLLAVLALVVVVFMRRRKSKKDETGKGKVRSQSRPPDPSTAPSRQTYQSVADPPTPGPSSTDNPVYPTVIVRTEVSVINPPSRPERYENVGNNATIACSTVNATDKIVQSNADNLNDLYSNHTMPFNKMQQANNAINPPSQMGEEDLQKNLDDLYSNHVMTFAKVQEGKTNNLEETQSVNYATTNSAFCVRGGNHNQPSTSFRGDPEYDVLKLPKV